MSGKPWQRRGGYARALNTRGIRERFLICCEGEKTEPNYFGKFPIKIDLVQIDIESGANTLGLINDALKRKEKAEKANRPYNQVWCVFDRDSRSTTPDQFNKAIQKAQNFKIRVAYSNPCFELWYYLHFHYIVAAIDCAEYTRKLSVYLKKEYEKNSEEMYECLKGKQQTAIKNGKRLQFNRPFCNPEKDNPSTTVHLLVDALNAFIDEGEIKTKG